MSFDRRNPDVKPASPFFGDADPDEHEVGLDDVGTDPMVDELLTILEPATPDEYATVMDMALRCARKVMGEGRTEHGALDLATDTRTIAETLEESMDEIVDGLFYGVVTKRKLERETYSRVVSDTGCLHDWVYSQNTTDRTCHLCNKVQSHE